MRPVVLRSDFGSGLGEGAKSEGRGSGRAPEPGGGDGAVDMPGDGPPGGADGRGGGDGLVVRGQRIQHLVMHAAAAKAKVRPSAVSRQVFVRAIRSISPLPRSRARS